MNFPHNDTVPYPFSDDIFPDEDGVGYALRMSDANALSFHQLAVALASPGHRYLPYTSAPALAFMFGGTPKSIAKAFVHRHFQDGITVADYVDHLFLRPKHLRQTCPQICPLCLLDDRRALASWSLTMMCCCTKHEICLVDRCTCGAPISWRRRSLHICACGRMLSGPTCHHRMALKGAIAICRQIEYMLGAPYFRLTASMDSVLSVFDEVTLDVFVRLVWTIGSFDTGQDRCNPRRLNAFPSPSDVMQIADNAFHRIRAMLMEDRTMRNWDWIPHLTSIADDAVTLADRRVMSSIIEKLCPRTLTTRRLDRRLPVQLPLFET